MSLSGQLAVGKAEPYLTRYDPAFLKLPRATLRRSERKRPKGMDRAIGSADHTCAGFDLTQRMEAQC